MLTLVDGLEEVRTEIDRERAGIVLFALFEREDSAGKWDLIFSASWITRNEDERPALSYLMERLWPKLPPRELLSISRVVVFQPEEPLVQVVLTMLRMLRDPSRIAPFEFNGMSITRIILIEADPNYSSLPAVPDIEGMQRETQEHLDVLARQMAVPGLQPRKVHRRAKVRVGPRKQSA